MITVWDTGHDHSHHIVPQILEGMLLDGEQAKLSGSSTFNGSPVPSVFYGVLRGNTPIIKKCIEAGVDWWFIDNGFFKPGRYQGHYRIGKMGLQPKYSTKAPVDPTRWDALGIKIHPWRTSTPESHVLVCPPTPAMSEFYGICKEQWTQDTVKKLSEIAPNRPVRVREKGTPIPLTEDFVGCHCVVTFNSNVAMEALILGIPAIMDLGTVKDWNKLGLSDVEKDLTSHDRRALFRFAASCQFRLSEFRAGGAWTAIRRLLG